MRHPGAWRTGIGLMLWLWSPVFGNGGVCESTGFRDAFLAGLDSEDFREISTALKDYGEEALPCLERIARDGGERHGLMPCASNSDECRVWAVRALSEIGTPGARSILIRMLEAEQSQRVLLAVIVTVGLLKAPDARVGLLTLLRSEDPHIRAESVAALGAIGDSQDFEVLLGTTLSLPDEQVHKAATGLLLLQDRRALEPLRKRAEAIQNLELRKNLLRILGTIAPQDMRKSPS